MNVAQTVARALYQGGVRASFGVLGSGNFLLANALREAGIDVHTARHENNAMSMTDGYGRASGRVAVCTTHQGPGFTNALTALVEAAKARTPAILLTADTPAGTLWSNFQVDQTGIALGCGAIVERVRSPATAAEDAARALRRSLVERLPVVLNVPVDLPGAPVPEEHAEAPRSPMPAPPAPDPATVEAAAELIADAERVLILAGRGAAVSPGAREALEALGERTGALLATSAMAHGLFAGLPFALGIAGGFASPLAAELMAAADVVVAFGATLNMWTTRHGALFAPDARLIQIDVDATAIGAHRPADVAIVGDVRATAQALVEALVERGHEARGRRTAATAEAIAARRWRDEPYEDAPAPGTIDPRTLAIALDDLLPPDRAVAVDSGAFSGWPAMYVDVADPRAWLFCNAFQSVGLALGGAIGAAVARPDRITVAALGDGGAFLALQELDTAARLGVPVLVVVWDDAAYGAEVHHFGPMGEDVAIARFPDADLAAIARGAGVQAHTVRSVDDLGPVAEWAADPAGPFLLDAKVDPGICGAWLEEAFRTG